MSIELLAPVGSIESFKAAVQNKADAVYLGGKQFGARAYANNFSNDEIKEMIAYAHLFDVKVFVTVNTIVYDDEFDELISFLDFLYENDCDAIILQDLGVINFVRKRYPNLDLHASTQMNIHSVEQAKVLKQLGFSRIVLARELSLEEIINIKQNVDIEIEVFVHGALCVSHSGNCYFSSIVGKRSGNRGRCAQPCRLEYTINDETGYLISPKDLNTMEYIDKLIEANITSLKIEGRMKRPEYVAQIVQSYREAIDNYYHKSNFNINYHQKELKKIFNRSFTKGFLFKENNKDFVNKDYSNHIGIEVGKVLESSKDYVQIKLTDKVQKGDSLRITTANEVDAITINQMYIGKKLVEEANAGDVIRLRSHKDRLDEGVVFLTTSFKQIQRLESSFKEEKRKIEIEGKCFIEDNYLTLLITDGVNYIKQKTESIVEVAKNNPTNERIFEQLNKTSSTPFVFKHLDIEINFPVYISIKEINDLRRKALEELQAKRSKKHPNRLFGNFDYITYVNDKTEDFKIKVKVRNVEQLQAAIDFGVKDIYVTDKTLLKYEEYPDINFSYVLPRINKEKVETSEYYGVVSSDISNLNNVTTSIYMNVANSLAVNLLESFNVKTIGLSLELSFDQIKSLIKNYEDKFHKKPNLEIMVYGRYELMMMKYCPINATIGCSGCKEQDVKMTDRKGFEFPIYKEKGCSIKILNSKKLHLKDYLREIYNWGINNVLLDFTTENYQEVYDVCDIYFNNSAKQIEEVTFGHFKEGVL